MNAARAPAGKRANAAAAAGDVPEVGAGGAAAGAGAGPGAGPDTPDPPPDVGADSDPIGMAFRVMQLLQRRDDNLLLGSMARGSFASKSMALDYAEDGTYETPAEEGGGPPMDEADGAAAAAPAGAEAATGAGAGGAASSGAADAGVSGMSPIKAFERLVALGACKSAVAVGEAVLAVHRRRHGPDPSVIVLTPSTTPTYTIDSSTGQRFGNDESARGIDLKTEAGVAALKALAAPAPFGDLTDQTTRVDASVRDALRIDDVTHLRMANDYAAEDVYKDSYATTGKGGGKGGSFTRFDRKFEFAVNLPGAERHPGRLDFSRARINIYSAPAGHFVEHVDTPSGEDCIGTLVYALNPGGWTGGELVITGPMGRVAAWTGTVLRRDTEVTEEVHGVSFYSDCTHTVTPVTSGTRITLTVPLRHAADGGSLRYQPSTVVASLGGWTHPLGNAVVEQGAAILRTMVSRIRAGGKWAHTCLLLTHGYTCGNLTSRALKGIDRSIYEMARAALGGRDPIIQAVIVTVQEQSRDYEPGPVSINVYGLDPALMIATAAEVKASVAASDVDVRVGGGGDGDADASSGEVADSSGGAAARGGNDSADSAGGEVSSTTPGSTTVHAGYARDSAVDGHGVAGHMLRGGARDTLFIDAFRRVDPPADIDRPRRRSPPGRRQPAPPWTLTETVIPYSEHTGNEAQAFELYGEYLRAALVLS